MGEFSDNPDGAANEDTKISLNESNTATVQLDLDESKAHLINANGGAGGDHDDVKTAIIDPTSASSEGEISFTGLGKEEVMRYANDPFWVRLRYILFILFWVGWLAMLVTAIVIIVLAPRCPPRPDHKWYQTQTVYQVFPKSFKDSNNDGVGDFGGLTEKLDYIRKDLNIKALWINSIFKTDKTSSLGVIDHKAIDESFGVSIDSFQSWLKKLRKEGIYIILDLIPNQTGKNHTWFQKSLQNEEPYSSYYIWAPGVPTQPPNNWKTVDGQPAWTYDNTKGAWYYHQFSRDYPDLNLTNENVRNEIKDIMRFWFDSGVSGFHVEGLEYLVESPDLNAVDEPDSSPTRNYVGTLDFLEELRAVADEFSDKPGRERLLFGTVRHASPNQTREYWGSSDQKRLHIVAPLLQDLNAACNAGCVNAKVNELVTGNANRWLGLQLGDENTPRIASRMDDGTDIYKARLIMAHVLQLLMPGTPVSYYGDEFGQRNGNTGTGNPEDDYRTPMQWNTEENAGFTGKGVQPWLPVGPTYKTDNIQASEAHNSNITPLKAFKMLVNLRARESFQWGTTKVCSPHVDLLLFTRQAERFPYFLVLINTGSTKIHVSPGDLSCVSTNSKGNTVFYTDFTQNKLIGVADPAKDRSVSLDNGINLNPFEIEVIEFAAPE